MNLKLTKIEREQYWLCLALCHLCLDRGKCEVEKKLTTIRRKKVNETVC